MRTWRSESRTFVHSPGFPGDKKQTQTLMHADKHGGADTAGPTGRPISRAQAWVLATRPKTLPASAAPILVGSAVAWSEDVFSFLPALVALVCAMLIQIGTNLANDYFDFIKGADTEKRLGPIRVTQSGLIAPRRVRNAMLLTLGTTFVLGLYLVAIAGWPVFAAGVLSLACAVLYTAGPFPLAYNGLGDVFVFVFFGIVAVTGAHYVQSLHFSWTAFGASLPIGALTTAILVVNNYRDIDTDREAGKKTMAVRIGRKWTRVEFASMLAIAGLFPAMQALALRNPRLLFPALCLPLGFRILRVMSTSKEGPVLNEALASTGRFLLVYAMLYSAGFILGRY